MQTTTKHASSLYPIPIWQFVLTLDQAGAVKWGEETMRWMVRHLQALNDDVFYHMSASNSSLTDFVRRERIDLGGKTAHCDLQHYVWKLNVQAGNQKAPIDSLWTDPALRFFRNGRSTAHKWIHIPGLHKAVAYARELSLRPYKQTGRGVICPAQDGCFCRSLDEVRIDDWLFKKGIHHIKEPIYPVHPTFNRGGRKRADWRVGDIYIEYAGLLSDEEYAKKLGDKIRLAKALHLQLVVLKPSDLNKLDEVLLPKLVR